MEGISGYMKKFDKEIKKIKLQKTWHRYERYFYIGVSCLMIILLVMFIISNKNTIFDNSRVDSSLNDTIGAYIDGEYSKTISDKGDGYIVQKIVCNNGAVSEWDNDKWIFTYYKYDSKK